MTVSGQTEFEGEISGEWTTEDSPYIQIGAASVPVDNTLEIRPGVTIVLHEDEEFLVQGVIQAIGEEDNLINFTHPEGVLGQGISIESENDEIINFECCRFDSLDHAIESRRTRMVISHCSFFHCRDAIDCAFQQADVNNCYSESTQQGFGDFSFGVNGEPGGFYMVTNNIFNNGWMALDIVITRADSAFISGNDANRFDIRFSRNVEVVSNHFGNIDAGWSSGISIDNNEITGSTLMNTTQADVINNTCNNINYRSSSGNIRNNYADDIDISLGSNVSCTNNICDDISVSQSNSIITGNELERLSVTHGSEASFYNNTVYSPDVHEWIVELIESSLIFYNNIICAGDEVNIAFRGWDYDLEGGFNCFYGFEEIYPDNDPLEGDFTANPLFRRAGYGDLRLRSDSPCIDAGDPESDEDPDGTRADIGAYYFDQRGDGPPCIISNNDAYGTIGLPFSYTAIAVDDGDEIRFEFDGLPFWLREVERDDIIDSVTVSGEVPEDQEEFIFLINVTDDDGLEDTLSVFVGIDSLHILNGYISAILRREDSPFLINDTAIVAADDSLIIEPGCRLIFKRQNNGERSVFFIYGSIFAEGTEDDSIYISRFNNASWDGGFRLEANERTESLFSYCNVQYGLGSFGKNISVSNCSFQFGTLGVNDAIDEFIISNNTFESNTIYLDGDGVFSGNILSNSRISAWNGSILIFENEFNSGRSAISTSNVRFADIHDNYVQNCEYGISLGGNQNEIDYSVNVHNNYIINCNNGISIGQTANYQVSNNLIAHSTERSISTYYPNSNLANNVIFDSPVGIYYNTAYDIEYSLDVLNNLFLDIDTLLTWRDYPVRDDQYFAYNCFYNVGELGNDIGYLGQLNRTNTNDDSTDANLNLYLNPQVFQVDSLDFHLYEDSPLIDAGHPDSIYIDLDGSINDIGLYGGQYGEEYDYSVSVSYDIGAILEEFRLFNPYPNPFNENSIITFYIPNKGPVNIRVFDLQGRTIALKSFDNLYLGFNRCLLSDITPQVKTLVSGVYFVELTYNDRKLVKPLLKIQ